MTSLAIGRIFSAPWGRRQTSEGIHGIGRDPAGWVTEDLGEKSQNWTLEHWWWHEDKDVTKEEIQVTKDGGRCSASLAIKGTHTGTTMRQHFPQLDCKNGLLIWNLAGCEEVCVLIPLLVGVWVGRAALEGNLPGSIKVNSMHTLWLSGPSVQDLF